MNKTIYILGAGFSMDAGAPSQTNLVKSIFELKNNDSYSKTKQQPLIHKWIDELDKFLKEGLCVSEEEKTYYTLEDIYTPIDKCISENISFRNYAVRDLKILREHLNRLITLAIRESIDKSNKSKDTIDEFARFITEQSRKKLNNKKIEVYLVENDNPHRYEGNIKYLTAGYRYQNFFSNRDLTINYTGVKGFVKNNCPE